MFWIVVMLVLYFLPEFLLGWYMVKPEETRKYKRAKVLRDMEEV